MKTAQTIAQQGANADSRSEKKPKHRMHPNSLKNLVAPWTPETTPMATGQGRKRDVSGEISRAAIENNREEIYKAVTEKLLAGDAYAFSVHADRGYGKLKQGVIHTGDEEGGPIVTSLKVEFVTPK